jgi:epsin
VLVGSSIVRRVYCKLCIETSQQGKKSKNNHISLAPRQPSTMEFLKDITKDFSVDKIRNLAEDTFNSYKPKSEVEERVYEVLSHKNWGASSSLMNDVAADTLDYEKFQTVTSLMWQAMDSRPSAWRVVFKALTLLEHLVKNGSERCVDDARNHSHKLRSLANFNYFEGTVDRGVGVREKSKQLVELLSDNDRIREEREKARALRDKFSGRGAAVESGSLGYTSSSKRFDDTYEGYFSNKGNSGTMRAGGEQGGSGPSTNGSLKGKIQGFGSDDAAMPSRGYSGRYSGESPSVNAAVQSKQQEDYSSKKVVEPAKVKKAKKLKKKEESSAATHSTVANIDLLSLDINDSSAAPGDNDFDAFGSFEGSTPHANATNIAFDAFGTSTIPTPTIAPMTLPGTVPPPPSAMDAFGAFQSFPSPTTSSGNVLFSGMDANVMAFSGGIPFQQQHTVMNSDKMTVASLGFSPQQQPSNMMATQKKMQQAVELSSLPPAASANGDDDEDFGGFTSATNKVAIPSSDPIAKLISLDSLSKNKKKENPLEKPILFNELAAAQIEQKPHDEENVRSKSLTAELSFRGIDGLSGSASPAALASKSVHKNKAPGVPIMQTSENEKAQLIGMMGEIPAASVVGVQQQQVVNPTGSFQPMGLQPVMPMQMTPQLMQQMIFMQQQQAMLAGGNSSAQGAAIMNNHMINQQQQPMGGMNPQMMMMMMHSNPQMFGVTAPSGQMSNVMQGMGGNNNIVMGGSAMGGQSGSNPSGMMGGQPMQGWH